MDRNPSDRNISDRNNSDRKNAYTLMTILGDNFTFASSFDVGRCIATSSLHYYHLAELLPP